MKSTPTPIKQGQMWCDLRKPVTWCKIDILRYWYYDIKIWIILIPELFTWVSYDTGIKSYWFQKLSNMMKNIRITMLISFILQFHPLRHVMVSQITSQIKSSEHLILWFKKVAQISRKQRNFQRYSLWKT